MLIDQSYEPLAENDKFSLELVLNLPKKVMVNGMYMYTLELKFIEPTYLHIKYISREKQTLVEARINLSKNTAQYIDVLYDYFEENNILIINSRENEYGDNIKCIGNSPESDE